MRPADAVTLCGVGLASSSMILGIGGHYEWALTLVALSYAMDVIDGIVARRLGGWTKEGLMLDRASDRISQVVAPIVIYSSWLRPSGLDLALLTAYSSLMVSVAIYRLVYRVVETLNYYSGLPMFVHAIILLSSVGLRDPIDPLILLGLAALSAAPIPYMRKVKRLPGPSPAAPARLLLVALIAAAPHVEAAAMIVFTFVRVAAFTYALLGPLPPLLGLTPGPGSSIKRGAPSKA